MINLQAEETNVDDCKETNVDDCFMSVHLCIKSLERIRTNLKFKVFYDTVVQKASEVLCDSPVHSRQTQIPKSLNDGVPQHLFSLFKNMWKRIF